MKPKISLRTLITIIYRARVRARARARISQKKNLKTMQDLICPVPETQQFIFSCNRARARTRARARK